VWKPSCNPLLFLKPFFICYDCLVFVKHFYPFFCIVVVTVSKVIWFMLWLLSDIVSAVEVLPSCEFVSVGFWNKLLWQFWSKDCNEHVTSALNYLGDHETKCSTHFFNSQTSLKSAQVHVRWVPMAQQSVSHHLVLVQIWSLMTVSTLITFRLKFGDDYVISLSNSTLIFQF
jgi:hypothetical protein